ncbi:M20/M25/M40 family metallo-hydrolase, partial [Ornithinicoccus halotolerans]|uniref:M20/M25/M40 family metallo-hydrolase n=1 Tax=Ornithinicoccus halotolerans TaxID=1748220 RepID=UPI001294C087
MTTTGTAPSDSTPAVLARDWVTDRLEDLLADIALLVGLETPSLRPDLLGPGLDAIHEWLRQRLGEPATTARHDGGARGDVLDLTWPGTGPGTVLALCHYDTVWPEGTLAEWPLTRDGDVLSGPGVIDMKAGIAQVAWALLALRALGQPHPTVRVMLTPDEEVGSVVGRPHLERAAAECDLTVITEPSGEGHVKVRRKGMVFADVRLTGVESHAGLDPFAGASAVHELARLIPRICSLADHDRGTTVNVGAVGGGTGRNVVAGRAWCEVDVRVQDPEEADRVATALAALAPEDDRVGLEMLVDRNRPPMNPGPATEGYLALAQQVAAELGHRIAGIAVGGASDGNFIAALGLPVLDGVGGIGGGPHSRREHVLVSGLPRQTALLAGLLARCAHGPPA